MKKIRKKLQSKSAVILFFIVFAVLYTIIYIVPKVTDIFVQTYTAEYGTLEMSIDSKCIIIRDEQVYKASVGGSVDRKIEAGELIRKDSLVATVGGREQYTDRRGIVSYYYDGYENKINSEKLSEIKENFFNEFSEGQNQEKEAVSDTAEAGDVIFKIVDNKRWFLMCWLDEEDGQKFEEGRAVKASFDDNDPVDMKVYSNTKQGSKYQLILSCNNSYKDFDRYRIKECKLITSSYSGIILETDSIVEKDGVKGVYVVNKLGNSVFTPVSVLLSTGGKTVVEKNYYYDSEGKYVETVESYDEILKKGK